MNPLSKSGVCAILAGALAMPAQPCTTFVSDGVAGPLFARNYDFEFGEALLVVNPRGLVRGSATGDDGAGVPARWASTYGSVTFNQFGVGFPTGGMNERGLVVELLWLDGTRYPAPDARPTVSTLEFIQYLLDQAGTLQDALAAAGAVRIAGRTPLHFLVSDSAGRAATIEFLDGKLVVHTADSLPVRALANDRYDASLKASRTSHPAPSDVSSLARFARAAAGAGGTKTVDQALAVLDSVAQPGATHWQIVYEMAPRVMHWRTSGNSRMRSLSLGATSFDCKDGIRLADAGEGRGDFSSSLKPYTRAADEAQLRVAYRKVSFFRGDAAKEAAADAAATEQRYKCA
jgi:penicillin V acylase-like amidase (Ntn superfamily)